MAISPLTDVTSEQLQLRAGSGLEAEHAMDVGVRDGPSTEPRMGKSPRNGRGCAGAFHAGWDRSGSGARWWAIGEVAGRGDFRRWLFWPCNWRTLIVLKFRRLSWLRSALQLITSTSSYSIWDSPSGDFQQGV